MNRNIYFSTSSTQLVHPTITLWERNKSVLQKEQGNSCVTQKSITVLVCSRFTARISILAE